MLLAKAAIESNDAACLERALEGAKELAEKTGLELFIEDIEKDRPIFQLLLNED